MSDTSNSLQEILTKTLGKIRHLSMHHFWRFIKEQGLSMTQIITLRHLHHHDANKECNISDISARLGLTNAAVSQSLDKLVKKGLVERKENPQDRRSKQILLTKKGKGMLTKSMQAQQSWLEDLIVLLTMEEKAKIQDAFLLLAEKITEMEKR